MSRSAMLAICIFILALVPRIFANGDFWTSDEARHWSPRVENFILALEKQHFADTNLTGHPGVTTMWLGAMGAMLHRQIAPEPALYRVLAKYLEKPNELLRISKHSFSLYLYLLRLPIGIITALGIALSYILLRRLINVRLSSVAALLWATDPFLVAHSKILHVDALLTTFIMLTLLTALLAFKFDEENYAQEIHWKYLICSGIAGGLAFLTKSPSVILIPMLGLIALVHCQSQRKRLNSQLTYLFALILWGSIAISVWFVLWPAAWVDPLKAGLSIFQEAKGNGGATHEWGNFFLGQSVGDPGPLHYPVAIVLRLTPWAMLGILLLILPLMRREKVAKALSLLIAFALLFTLMLTIPPKKFDRYLLPVFPILDFAAALGLIRFVQCCPRLAKRQNLALGLIGLGTIGNLWFYHPYELAYYNPLLGGGRTAARAIFVGWGEGLEQAGEYIEKQPNGCDYAVGTWYELVLQRYICTPAMELGWAIVPGKLDYVVFYINQLQRANYSDVFALAQKQGTLVKTVQIHEIDYAFVYQLPRPTTHQITADFGDAIRLIGYDLDSTALKRTGLFTLTTQWQSRALLTDDVILFIHLLDQNGKLIAQADLQPGGPRAPTSLWQPLHYYSQHHSLPLPANLAPGKYWLALGLYHSKDFSRLPLKAKLPENAPNDGQNALLLEPLTLP